MARRVRPAEPRDVEGLVRLTQRWAAEGITHGLAAVGPEHWQEHVDRYLWVAEDDAQLVGYASGRVRVSEGLAVIPQGEAYIEIDEVYVDPEHRDQGVGSELLEALLAEAQAHGVTRALVYSATKDWERIVGFYRRHGFHMWYVMMYR